MQLNAKTGKKAQLVRHMTVHEHFAPVFMPPYPLQDFLSSL